MKVRFSLLFALSILLLSSIVAFMPLKKNKVKIFIAGDSTASIKEPKSFPETGWGMPFVHFWDSTVSIENLAKNGRSTKSFIKEGLWSNLIAKVSEGDYVIIQFGHNDEAKEKGERYATPDTFKMNLNRFIAEVREKNAIPILFTPVSRRKFDNNGTAMETHKEYSAYVKEVAVSTQVLFYDLDSASRALYQQFGKDNSKLLFLQLAKGEHPNYPEGKEDNTHFNELGARLIAQMLLQFLKANVENLNDRVIIRPVKK